MDKEGSVFSLASLTDDDDDASSQCSSTRRVSLSAMSNVTPPVRILLFILVNLLISDVVFGIGSEVRTSILSRFF